MWHLCYQNDHRLATVRQAAEEARHALKQSIPVRRNLLKERLQEDLDAWNVELNKMGLAISRRWAQGH